eukprot:gene8954-13863_t
MTPSKSVTFAEASGRVLSAEERSRLEKDAEARTQLVQAVKDKERNRLLLRHLSTLPKNLYLRRRDLTVAVCTWNVAEAAAQRVSGLEKWLQAKRSPDIIAVGLQEVDMSAMALATSSTGKSDPWLDCLSRHLIPFSFRRLTHANLVGIFLAIFVKIDLYPYVEQITTKEIKLGTGGFTGNKGACVASFMVHCKRFVFVSSHFVPHQENTEKRNENFHFILNYLTQHDPPPSKFEDPPHELVCLGPSGGEGPRSARATSSSGGNFFGSPKSSQQANNLLSWKDYVFWFGDLNYRIDTSYEEVMIAIAHKNYNNILAGHKKRVPAYTDRILYFSQRTTKPDEFLPTKSNFVVPMKYKAYQNPVSDHFPVSCLFKVAVYTSDPQAMTRVMDMAGAGMSSASITEKLSQRPGLARDEQELFKSIVPPPVDTKGPGTAYSSEEEDENTDLKQRRRLEDRLQALETFLKSGPMPGDRTLDEIRSGQSGLQVRLSDLTSKLAEMPVAPHEEINLLGESMTHVLDKLQSVEELLSSANNETPLHSSVNVLRDQFSDLTKRMDVFITSVSEGGSPSAQTLVPLQYQDSDDIDEDERKSREKLRAVFLAGAAAAKRGQVSITASLDPNSAAFEELMEERQTALARREQDLNTMIRIREAECDRREKNAREREADMASRTGALETLQTILEDRIRAAESLKATESTAAESLQRREEEVRAHELRLLQQRAKLSSQQLKLKQDLADLEATRTSFSSQLQARETMLSTHSLGLASLEEKLEAQFGQVLPPPEWSSERPPWKGVLEGSVPDSPSRANDGRVSPLTSLLKESNLLATSESAGKYFADWPKDDGFPGGRAVTTSPSQMRYTGPDAAFSPSPMRHRVALQPPTHSNRRRNSSTTHPPGSPQSQASAAHTARAGGEKKQPPFRDALAVHLQQFMHDSRLPQNFARVSRCNEYPDAHIYTFGTRKVSIRLMGEAGKEARVLLHSGWMPFQEFLNKFGGAEQRRLIRAQQLP